MTDPDLRMIRRDDRLLDQLGRGEPVTSEDDVEVMLAAWRHTLPDPAPPDPRLLAAMTPKRPRRRLVAPLSVAASVALLGGGVLIGAAYSGPDSPLWPVTRVMYGPLAESRQALAGADDAVAEARTAAAEGRYPDAARLLATADALLDKVDAAADRQRLRDDISKIRHQLPASSDERKKTPANTHEAPGQAEPEAEQHEPRPPADDTDSVGPDNPGKGHDDEEDEDDPENRQGDDEPEDEPPGHEHGNNGNGPNKEHP